MVDRIGHIKIILLLMTNKGRIIIITGATPLATILNKTSQAEILMAEQIILVRWVGKTITEMMLDILPEMALLSPEATRKTGTRRAGGPQPDISKRPC